MPDVNDNIATTDQVQIAHTTGGGTPEYREVEVVTDVGIFKGGVQYNKGDKAIISRQAAEAFAASGDVKILGETATPDSVQKELDDAKNT